MEKLLNAKEVQDLLQLGRHTVYLWVAQGKLPHIRLGRKVLFSLPQIQKWLEQQSSGGAVESWTQNA